MQLRANPLVAATDAPPIAEAMSWVKPGARNRPLINLCQAVPSYPPAEAMQAEIARLARLPATSLYTDILGTPELRAALAAHLSEDYQGGVAPEQVAIAAGCNQAFCAAMMALAGPGDEVVLPAPYYFNHRMWLDMLGIAVKTPAMNASGFAPDVELLAAEIGRKTRAIVLCTPNNPTGAIYGAAELSALFDLCRARDIALVVDETYKDFRPNAAPPHGLLARADWPETFVQLYSFSKVFAMTGYRVGAIVASSRLMDQIGKIMDCVAICAPAISQGGALHGLAALDGWKAEKRELMAERLMAVRRAFATPGLGYTLASSGAYFAYVEHPFSGLPAKAVARMLAEEHDLLCLPGSMFGPGQERYLRLAFANVEADVMPLMAERLLDSQKARPGMSRTAPEGVSAEAD